MVGWCWWWCFFVFLFWRRLENLCKHQKKQKRQIQIQFNGTPTRGVRVGVLLACVQQTPHAATAQGLCPEGARRLICVLAMLVFPLLFLLSIKCTPRFLTDVGSRDASGARTTVDIFPITISWGRAPRARFRFSHTAERRHQICSQVERGKKVFPVSDTPSTHENTRHWCVHAMYQTRRV